MINETKLEIINGEPMMGSRKIATVVSKEHGKVCRDIRVMLGKLYGLSEEECTRNPDLAYLTNHGVTCYQYDNDNPNAWEYWLDHEHSQCLVSGYDPVRRMAIIKHWQQMKKELSQPRIAAPQDTSMNNDILSLARVVAEATASATMKAVIDIVGIQKPQPFTLSEPAVVAAQPAPETLQVNHHELGDSSSEYALVSELSWISGLSDSACRRLATFAALPTTLTGVERGHLMINRASFMSAAQTLLDESTPPTGKLKRWQHPEFGGFALRLKSSEATPEAK